MLDARHMSAGEDVDLDLDLDAIVDVHGVGDDVGVDDGVIVKQDS